MLYLTLRQYEYVVAVAEARSLTGAAARLNVSQPSLSVAISRVEQVLGQRVFQRQQGAALQITPYGHRFVAEARTLLAQARQLEQGAEATRPFVLGCFEDIAPWYLAPALHHLSARFPQHRFAAREARFAPLAADVSEGRVDLAITYDMSYEKEAAGPFERRPLRRIAPVAFLAADHPLAAKPGLTLAELAQHPLILFAEALSESYVLDLFTGQGLQVEVAHRAASLETMRSLAAHGAGIGLSYSCPPGGQSYDGRPLITLPITTPAARAEVILFWSALRDIDAEFAAITAAVAGLGDSDGRE